MLSILIVVTIVRPYLQCNTNRNERNLTNAQAIYTSNNVQKGLNSVQARFAGFLLMDLHRY